MNKEEWEKGLSKFSDIVSDIFSVHDMEHRTIIRKDVISITTAKPSSLIRNYEVIFSLNRIGEIWANIYENGFGWANFPGQVDRLAVRCVHLINSDFAYFYSDEVRKEYKCEYCVVKNYD